MSHTDRTIQHVTIAQSASVSGNVSLVGASAIALFAPTVTSCQVFLQGNFDTTSANFFRVFDKDGAAQWSWDLGVGSSCIAVHDTVWPIAQVRVETSVAQANVRSIAVLTKHY